MFKSNINPHLIIKKLQSQKEVRDYTYATLFFLISSFFIFFVIKPSLTTAFSLYEKLDRLKQIDKDYEKFINYIIDLQNQLISFREDLPLINSALPEKPNIKKIVALLDRVASEESSLIKNLSISSLDLINKKEKINKVNIFLEFDLDFVSMRQLIRKIINSERLIDINRMSVSKIQIDEKSTESGVLKLELILESYYL